MPSILSLHLSLLYHTDSTAPVKIYNKQSSVKRAKFKFCKLPQLSSVLGFKTSL